MNNEVLVAENVNADPITGQHGSHPLGTTVGASGGAVTGAVVGAVAGGPVGALVGAAIGAVAGGAAGHGVGEAVNPTQEHSYWARTYRTRKYVDPARPYSDYQDAYRYGWESRGIYPARKWDEVEADLAKGWEAAKGKSALAWEHARQAAMDAWNRIETALPGDSDRDGR